MATSSASACSASPASRASTATSRFARSCATPSPGARRAPAPSHRRVYSLLVENPWSQRLGVWWVAEDRPDLPAVVASPSGVTLTFGDLAGRAHQLVHALRAQGIGAGDIVAYALPNDVDILWWPLAFQEMGVRSIALNPALSGAEVMQILEAPKAKGVVVAALTQARCVRTDFVIWFTSRGSKSNYKKRKRLT